MTQLGLKANRTENYNIIVQKAAISNHKMKTSYSANPFNANKNHTLGLQVYLTIIIFSTVNKFCGTRFAYPIQTLVHIV